jgi:hypothetical protein
MSGTVCSIYLNTLLAVHFSQRLLHVRLLTRISAASIALDAF